MSIRKLKRNENGIQTVIQCLLGVWFLLNKVGALVRQIFYIMCEACGDIGAILSSLVYLIYFC